MNITNIKMCPYNDDDCALLDAIIIRNWLKKKSLWIFNNIR